VALGRSQGGLENVVLDLGINSGTESFPCFKEPFRVRRNHFKREKKCKRKEKGTECSHPHTQPKKAQGTKGKRLSSHGKVWVEQRTHLKRRTQKSHNPEKKGSRGNSNWGSIGGLRGGRFENFPGGGFGLGREIFALGSEEGGSSFNGRYRVWSSEKMRTVC